MLSPLELVERESLGTLPAEGLVPKGSPLSIMLKAVRFRHFHEWCGGLFLFLSLLTRTSSR